MWLSRRDAARVIGQARLALAIHRLELTLAAGVVVGTAAVVALLGIDTDQGATRLLDAMTVVPFVIGILGGVPIVSRELEERTAMIAWSLNPSRRRWFWRQTLPVLLVVLAAATVAAATTSAVADAVLSSPEHAFERIGAHGPPAVARALAAFGVGLAIGAHLGRAMPALVFTAVILALMALISVEARHRWLGAQQSVIAPADTAELLVTGSVLVTPGGVAIGLDEALALAPANADAAAWLEAEGYSVREVGVPLRTALVCADYETIAFGSAALAGIAAAMVLVDRRRPS